MPENNNNRTLGTMKQKLDKSLSRSVLAKGRKSAAGEISMTSAAKKRRIAVPPVHDRGPGQLYTFGKAECGQLGLGPDINSQRKYPCRVEDLKDKRILQVAAGGMHTVVLEESGKVWTFGVNDDKALGRKTDEEEDQFEPGEVNLQGNKIVQISAGDSHSAALTEDGRVFAWGTFKDMNGNFGLVPGNDEKCLLNPQLISVGLDAKVFKIVSGDNHLVMLTDEGKIFTCGVGEQGQLGRPVDPEEVPQPTGTITRSRAKLPKPVTVMSKKDWLLTPAEVKINRKKFRDVWAGSFSTYCRSERSGEIWVFGLNNYGQLGFEAADPAFPVVTSPVKSLGFKGIKVAQIAAGQHHVVVLDEDGKVYVFGRSNDGRLGLGDNVPEAVSVPTPIAGDLANEGCVQVAAGLSTSYALTTKGELYAWGFGGNFQLGTGKDENGYEPGILENMTVIKEKLSLDDEILYVSAGGQHAAVILKKK